MTGYAAYEAAALLKTTTMIEQSIWLPDRVNHPGMQSRNWNRSCRHRSEKCRFFITPDLIDRPNWDEYYG